MNHVIIMRGIPGSGKTTEAKRWTARVSNSVIVSADDYMFAGGQEFNQGRLAFCHEQCVKDYELALRGCKALVIVDNTNTKFSDIVPYVEISERYGYTFTVMQINVDPKIAMERGLHGAPWEILELMGRRLWTERLPSTWDVWSKGELWRPPSQKRKPAEKVQAEKTQTAGYVDVILNARR